MKLLCNVIFLDSTKDYLKSGSFFNIISKYGLWMWVASAGVTWWLEKIFVYIDGLGAISSESPGWVFGYTQFPTLETNTCADDSGAACKIVVVRNWRKTSTKCEGCGVSTNMIGRCKNTTCEGHSAYRNGAPCRSGKPASKKWRKARVASRLPDNKRIRHV